MVAAPRQLRIDDLCIHQVSLSGQCDFAGSLSVLRDAGVRRTALWAPMIEACDIAEARRIWDASDMVAESLCVASLLAGEDALREKLDLADMGSHRDTSSLAVGSYRYSIYGSQYSTGRALPYRYFKNTQLGSHRQRVTHRQQSSGTRFCTT